MFKRIVFNLIMSFSILFSSLPTKTGIMDVIQWSIACGHTTFRSLVASEQILTYAIGSKVKYHLAIEAPVEVRDYIRDQLKDRIKNIEDFRVHIYDRLGPWDYGTNNLDLIWVGVDPETKKTVLEELLKKDVNTLTGEDHKKFDMINAILHHEAGHIKNKDMIRNTLMNFLIMFTTWKAFKNTQAHIEKYLPSKINFLLKFPSALGLLGLNMLLSKAYSRHIEQGADDSIPNTESLLLGAIEWAKQMQKQWQYQKNFILNMTKDWPANTKGVWLANFILSCMVSDIFLSHPNPTNRQAKFEKRLQDLKKTNEQ